MKILRLERARVLLWAREAGTGGPFEVSKVVDRQLQPRCSAAPRCPGGLDPASAPGGCPYGFARLGECVATRNRLALEAALFVPEEARLTRRLLESLRFTVEEEPIDPAADEGRRILVAHDPAARSRLHVQKLRSPAAGTILLVRRQRAAARTRPERPSHVRLLPSR